MALGTLDSRYLHACNSAQPGIRPPIGRGATDRCSRNVVWLYRQRQHRSNL